MDSTLYNTNSTTILKNTANDNDLENRLYFTLLNKNINVCNPLSSTNMSNCNNFYNNAQVNINNQLNREYTNANSYIHSNPMNAVFTNFPADNDNLCAPEYGKNRKQLYTANYTFPIINVHSDYIKNNYTTLQIQSIKNLSLNQSVTLTTINGAETVTFTRINDNYPEMYRLNKNRNCLDRPYRTVGAINTLWTQTTGCSQNLNNSILANINTTYDTLQYTPNENDVTKNFTRFTINNLASNSNPTDNIKLCYGNDGYLTINNSNKAQYSARSILRAGFRFNKDVVILSNGSYRLVFQSDGNLVLYRGTQPRWASDTSNSGRTLLMQHDGNLVIYNANGGPIWSSETSNNNNAYLELDDTGRLYIKNANGVIIKYLRDPIRDHLKSDFWDNSPDAVFSDKKGRFFPFKWNDGAVMTNNLLDPNKLPNHDCTGSDEFRGWCRSDGDSQWNERELDLLDINNYSQKTVGEDNKPNKSDPEGILSDNYNRGYDRNYFFSDGGNKVGNTGVVIRKPLQFLTNPSSKSNYLPGYERISYVDGSGGIGFSYKFLIMERGTARNNQAFVLYKKLQDKDAFATDIINNHPDIISKLETYFRNN
jgi:hypothetical protein